MPSAGRTDRGARLGHAQRLLRLRLRRLLQLAVHMRSPDTPIATPFGDRPIASIAVGDLVLSVDHGVVAAVPVARTRRTPVHDHRVIEIVLEGGAVLHVSAAHPTADGRWFGDLRPGDSLGGPRVVAARVVPYAHDATYDILPASDTGTYFAAGALIGSRLSLERPRVSASFVVR